MHLKMRRELTAAVLAMVMMLVCGVPAFAFSKNDILQPNSAGLYIATTPVPAGATAYARETIAGVLCSEYNLDRLILGTPFAVQGHDCDLYYFPVMYDNTIVGTYRVFLLNTGQYTGIYAEDPTMAATLNALTSSTTPLSPACIVTGQYEDLYAVTATKIHTVLSDYAGRITPARSIRGAASTLASTQTNITVNISEGIGFVNNVRDVSLTAVSQSVHLPWSSIITETQSGNDWCGAYATAAICRYVFNTRSYTAGDIMRWAYPTVSEADLPNKALSMGRSVTYGQLQGLSPQIVNAWPGIATIKAEINSDCPVYFYGERTGGAHAFVCCGYNMNTSSSGSSDPFYYVWNPWNPYTESVFADTNMYYASSTGNTYIMTSYIRNWE